MVDEPKDPNNPFENPEGAPVGQTPGQGEQPAPPPYTPGVDSPPEKPRIEADPYEPYDVDDESEVLQTNRGSSVAINQGKFIVIAAVLIIAMFWGFSLITGDDAPEETTTVDGSSPSNPAGGGAVAPPSAVPRAIDTPSAPILNVPTTVAPPPPPPPPPPPAPVEQVEEPVQPQQAEVPEETQQKAELPPPPPPPPATPELPEITPLKTFGGDKERKRRLGADMMVVSGRQTTQSQQAEEQEVRSRNAQQLLSVNDPNVAYMQNVLEITHSAKAGATRLHDMQHTIAQGKIIHAVLETAINTDLPGMLRAIVSRDIYAEAGKEVLIPKGSRLIGQYNTSVFRGQERVMVVWTRLIRPDGIDIAIGSPATDALGRAGIEGVVDNKYLETFSTAILTSILSIGVAYGTDQLIDDTGTTTRNTDGSTTRTGSTGAEAATEAVGNLGDVAQSVVENNLDLRPTITVDQGTRINVFVNRDLIFDTVGFSNQTGVFE